MEADKAAHRHKIISLYHRVMGALTKEGINKFTKITLDKKDPSKSLCAVMKKLTNEQIEKLLNYYLASCEAYSNGCGARDLADWWNTHQKLDAERERKEKEEKRIAALRKSALKKLTKAEREALGF
jgi:hypothetical protein